ncbi:MAG: hypothetical protein K2L30_10710 [Duncaniella sp.]|nr:hypothetical protein [Duncaniella sp.]
MKKFLYLLIALPALLLVSSCSDDDNDLPNVSFQISYSGAVDVDDVLYVVQGDTLAIDAINVTPAEGTKPASLGATTYFWDYAPVASTITVPFSMDFDTEAVPVGRHLLQIRTSVFQVDKSVAFAEFAYKIMVVESADDIPAGSDVGAGVLTPEAKLRTDVD